MKPYVPESLPLDTIQWNWEKLTNKVSLASSSIAYYNGILHFLANPEIFISPLEIEEAVFSSRIEGTVTTVDEILKFDADIKPDDNSKRNDIIEVLNYRTAMRGAKNWLLRNLPFNRTMICAIQKDLMTGVRGQDKKPGEIRKELVWIGPRNSTIEEATFVPPEPLGLDVWLDNLLEYLNNDKNEVLIQTAIMHAQFEILHPFLDGNGRTGRILIPILLWHKKRLVSPMFYISEYFEKYRDEYVGKLHNISEQKDWQAWIEFFLDAVISQAERNAKKAEQIFQLYNELIHNIASISNSPHGIKAIDTIFSKPILSSSDFLHIIGLNRQTSFRMLTRLKDEGILSTLKKASGRAPEVYRFDKLLQILG